MDISSGKFLIVSSFQNKSNCGRFKIVISLFSIGKYLFHAKISFFKQSQERDRWLHFFRCSTESAGTKTEALLRVVLGVVAFFALGPNFWDDKFKMVRKVHSEILTFTLLNLHKIVIKYFFSVRWMTCWRNANASKYRISIYNNARFTLRTKF